VRKSILFYYEFGGFGILPNEYFGEKLLLIFGAKIVEKQCVICAENGPFMAGLTPQSQPEILQK